MLQTEVRHSSDHEAPKILVGEMGGSLDCRENVKSGPAGLVGHRGQIDERFDLSIAKVLPDPLVLLTYLVLRRVRRPVNPNAPQVFEAHLDSTVTTTQGSVKVRLQARDSGAVDEVRGMALQHRQPFFRRCEITGQKLALRPAKL